MINPISHIDNIAKQTIKPAIGTVVFKQKGKTKNIIDQILLHDKDAFEDVVEFAPYLQGETVKDTAFNIWSFLKDYVTYKEDPSGKQFIKYPRVLFSSRVGDCKSLSLFTGAVLKVLGIPYEYRFTNYKEGNFKHVYVVIPQKDKEIIIDVVYDYFNKEKPYFQKKDIKPMDTEIYSLGSLEDKNLGNVTIAQLFITQSIDRLLAERKAAIAKGKNYKTTGYDSQLTYLNKLLNFINSPSSNIAQKRAYIISLMQAKPELKTVLQTVLDGLTIPASKIFNSLGSEQKKLVNQVFFEAIPNLSAYALYIFVPDNLVSKYLSEEGIAKRNVQKEILKNLSFFTGIPEAYILNMLKTEFIDKTGITPLSAVIESYKQNESIGALPAIVPALVGASKSVGVITSISKTVGGAFKAIGGLFGKKSEPSEEDLRNAALEEEYKRISMQYAEELVKQYRETGKFDMQKFASIHPDIQKGLIELKTQYDAQNSKNNTSASKPIDNNTLDMSRGGSTRNWC